MTKIGDDGFDTFDDDLEWILEKLNDRAGGSFGIIVRFLEGAPHPVMMARTATAAVLPAAVLDTLAGALRQGLSVEPDAEARELFVTEAVKLEEPCSSICLLHMNFRPAPGVDIVAAVGRPASSSTLLHGMVARRLYPVLSRYIRLWWLHRTERRRAGAFETAVDRAEMGVILLDRSGHVLYENAYARKIIDDADGMRRAGRNLLPADPADSLRLQVAIQHSIVCNSTGGPDANGAPLILLRRGEDKRALILTVLPHRGRAVDPGDAAAIVYVLHPERDVRKCLAPIYHIYGLTAAESRLVTELVNGANLNEAATLMNVSVGTVRAQLKQVFEKTRTNRQAELVRVMLASAVRSSVNMDLSLVQAWDRTAVVGKVPQQLM